MKISRRLSCALVALTFGLAPGLSASPAAGNAGIDSASGLIVDTGWETVKTHCTVCHSAKFITFQRGDRKSWASMIKWMQSTQGLWQFDESTEDTILTYLSKNYPPGKSSRRRNLPPRDLPQGTTHPIN